MKVKIIVIGCTIIFFSSVRLKAQVKDLTLKEALSYALENKADALKARLQVENSEYKIQEVRASALPQIALTGGLNYNAILQKSAIPGEFFGQPGSTILVPFGEKWMSTGGATLTQNIFNQAVFTGLKAAKSAREFYKINEQLTDEQVIERVANNYYQVFVQKQKLAVIDSNFINTNKVKNIIEGQYENGLARKIDLDRIKVKLSNINTQRQQIINAVQLQEHSLKFYMGMPINTPIKISEAVIEITPRLAGQEPDVTQHTEYQLLKNQEQLLIYQKKAVQAEFYPTLSLNANYMYQGLGNYFPLGATSKDGVNWSNFSTIGLNLKIPIFTGFGIRAKVRQAAINLRVLEEDIKDRELSLSLDFKNAETQIYNSVITINNQKENVALAIEVLENTKNNYYNGLASLTDLLDSENSLMEAQNNYTTALLEYKLAEVQLIKSQGALKSLLN